MVVSLRCLLVEDQLIYQESLAAMLARQPGLEMVGFASCPATAIRACSERLPDLLLLDLAQREQDALVVARAFSLLNPQGRVVVLELPQFLQAAGEPVRRHRCHCRQEELPAGSPAGHHPSAARSILATPTACS